jgi:hypothetical protein
VGRSGEAEAALSYTVKKGASPSALPEISVAVAIGSFSYFALTHRDELTAAGFSDLWIWAGLTLSAAILASGIILFLPPGPPRHGPLERRPCARWRYIAQTVGNHMKAAPEPWRVHDVREPEAELRRLNRRFQAASRSLDWRMTLRRLDRWASVSALTVIGGAALCWELVMLSPWPQMGHRFNPCRAHHLSKTIAGTLKSIRWRVAHGCQSRVGFVLVLLQSQTEHGTSLSLVRVIRRTNA